MSDTDLRRRVEALAGLLHEVLPETMGGYPDLFSPPGGWEAWEERARAALSATDPGSVPAPGVYMSCAPGAAPTTTPEVGVCDMWPHPHAKDRHCQFWRSATPDAPTTTTTTKRNGREGAP